MPNHGSHPADLSLAESEPKLGTWRYPSNGASIQGVLHYNRFIGDCRFNKDCKYKPHVAPVENLNLSAFASQVVNHKGRTTYSEQQKAGQRFGTVKKNYYAKK